MFEFATAAVLHVVMKSEGCLVVVLAGGGVVVVVGCATTACHITLHMVSPGSIRKWGLGDFNTTGYPLEQGFDVFVGQDSQVACHNWWPVHIQNGTDGSCLLPGNDFGKQGAHCIAANNSQCTWVNDLVTAQAVSFLRAHASQPDPPPFFIYVSTTTPHTGQLVRSVWHVPFECAHA